jgi:hypothetical protein
MKQQLVPMISASYFSTLHYTQLVKAQTHPLYVRAYSELSCIFGDDETDAAKAELEEDAIVCGYTVVRTQIRA